MAHFPSPLSAKFEPSWAYTTMKDRLPVIVAKTIDSLTRSRDVVATRYAASAEDVQRQAMQQFRDAIGDLSELRYEIMTNKPFTLLEDEDADVSEWNKSIGIADDGISTTGVPCWDENISEWPARWFDAPWLLAECYMYRRMHSAFAKRQLVKGFDAFFLQKEESFRRSLPAIVTMIEHMRKTSGWLATNTDSKSSRVKDEFIHLLQLCLWGNKCDMSITNGAVVYQSSNLFEQVDQYRTHILSNDSERAWQCLSHILDRAKAAQKRVRIDFVIDNAGYELFIDLCLADFLIAAGLADVIYFHVKTMPWFVSDAGKKDFYWTLEQCAYLARQKSACENDAGRHDAIDQPISQTSDSTADSLPATAAGDGADKNRKKIYADPAAHWLERLKDGSWIIAEDDFWTLPYEYDQMQLKGPDLYQLLHESNLIIFKGDLNYRKLVGDLNWPTTTPFPAALRSFKPTNLLALRTLKADVCVGLDMGLKERMDEKSPNWMISGEYAIVQLFQVPRNQAMVDAAAEEQSDAV